MESNDKIRQYWEERARQKPGIQTATTDDVYLRELEIATFSDTIGQLNLSQPATLLDVGCGDGYSTLAIAKQLTRVQTLGVDYSESMIQNARRNLSNHPELNGRITFAVGDVLGLVKACGPIQYDVVISDRCLINLSSQKDQAAALSQIAECTKLGGYYIAVENFMEGHENMNQARRSVGLPEIPVRWHNLYFQENEFVRAVAPYFEILQFKDFSSAYYFATRVIYSKMCQMRGEEPDYRHEIHQLAVRLPWTGKFSPIRMIVLRRGSGGRNEQ